MRARTLTAVALAWLLSALAGVHGETKPEIDTRSQEIDLSALIKAMAEEADPEPPLRARLSYDGRFFECRAPGPRDAEVESGAKGTTVQVPTHGLGVGSASLTFLNCAPPMRFTVKLTGAQSYDLSRLTLTSGPLSLAVGGVGTAYFDARGRRRDGPEGAAFTVRATRAASGEVEVQVRRGPGATLGKTVSVGWQHRASP
jgi:hypothetical protein